jgi:hypothetical protein
MSRKCLIHAPHDSILFDASILCIQTTKHVFSEYYSFSLVCKQNAFASIVWVVEERRFVSKTIHSIRQRAQSLWLLHCLWNHHHQTRHHV